MKEIDLLELLKAGVHFGHRKSKCHPKMKPYIFTVRSGIDIIDLEKTVEQLQQAMKFIEQLISEGKTLLLIGTKRQAKDIIKKTAQELNLPYVIERWLGGTLTNFENIRKLTTKLKHLVEMQKAEEWENYTKKEKLEFNREIEKLERLIGGIKDLKQLPHALFVIDVKKEATAIREAQRKGVPIIALVDTNCNPTGIKFPIASNDDATKTLELMMGYLALAVKDGRTKANKAVPAEILERKREITVKDEKKK